MPSATGCVSRQIILYYVLHDPLLSTVSKLLVLKNSQGTLKTRRRDLDNVIHNLITEAKCFETLGLKKTTPKGR